MNSIKESNPQELPFAPTPPPCYNHPNPNPQSQSYSPPHLPNFREPEARAAEARKRFRLLAHSPPPTPARFIQPDTIVPNPGDPQSLNRYSYAGNNPVRYTDPSGHFSEDEIMKYLHADNWDAVLAMFEKGGKFAGAWGFLEVLK